MDQLLQALIDDSQFAKYHAETLKGKTFNPFDVLRYSDYEIRHSNVLAWLLQPNETHGIGEAFIRKFASAMNDAARSQGITPPLSSGFDAENVRVERELDYVDITLFVENESVLIAVENKMGEASPEHASQVIGYDKMLREKYQSKYDIHSVLLTTSPAGDASARTASKGRSERRFIHGSWSQICDIVKSIRDHGRFEVDQGDRVRAFLEHYLEIVERFVIRPDGAGDSSKTLLDDHRPLLERLSKEREEGSGNIDEILPQSQSEYARTIDRLIGDFRQEPKRLRSAIRRLLKRRGFRAWTNTPAGQPWFFLYFSDENMDETRRSLNVPGYPRWVIFLSRGQVLLYLQFDASETGMPVVERITRFMLENPIDASSEGQERYPMDIRWGGRFIVYKHILMTGEELAATPASAIEEVVLKRMDAFLDVDFGRIETYLKCMAFNPAPPA